MRQVFFIVALLATSAHADEIPLKDIWASDMPGTTDVRDLEPVNHGPKAKDLPVEERQRRNLNSKVQKIERHLRNLDKPIGQGFAVPSTAEKSLEQAFEVLVENAKPKDAFSTKDDISIVFFTVPVSRYVYIKGVERNGNTIHIQLDIVLHTTKELTNHFALIPIGKLPAGNYQVELEILPLAKEYAGLNVRQVDQKWMDSHVCKEFSFSVTD